MKSLICGSLAYDTIMAFNGRFSDVLLSDQLHKINAAFLVPRMRREFGGCAGNIAYNLKLLGGDPVIMATVGQDADAYLQRLAALDISTRCIKIIEDSYTAQAFITTDEHGNQLTAFHPGAMTFSHLNHVDDAGPVKLAIIAPDGRDGMLQHAAACAEKEIPFIFDPGQGLPMFNGEELKQLIGLAAYVTVNEYESAMLVDRTGSSLENIASGLKGLLVTKAEHGVQVFSGGKTFSIPGVVATDIADPTGCGDAFRAGLLLGLSHEMDWETTGRLANLMGSIKIAHQGGQNHAPSLSEIAERFHKAYGYRFMA